MRDVFAAEVHSITTDQSADACIWTARTPDCMKGKRVLIVDDVISTGESLQAPWKSW